MIIRYLLLVFLYTYGTVLYADGGLFGTDSNIGEFNDYNLFSLSDNRLQGDYGFAENHPLMDNLILASNQAETRALKATGPVEKRHALVIGNSKYSSSPLKNPANDAKAMAQRLSELGFDVIKEIDAGKNEIIQAIRDFGKMLNQSKEVGLFYYAGHAVQMDGENYLIPTDVPINSVDKVRYHAVNLNDVFKEMEDAENRLNIVILDACRNNPFPSKSRSVGEGGLAKVKTPRGTLIAYSTAPGNMAADGVGYFSPFTKQLIQHMGIKDLELDDMFKAVGAAVESDTNDQQSPWTSTSYRGDFYFAGGNSGIDIDKDDLLPIEVALNENKNQESDTLGRFLEVEKPWYKRWYVWAGVVAVAILAACSGSGEGGTAGSGGSGGSC